VCVLWAWVCTEDGRVEGGGLGMSRLLEPHTGGVGAYLEGCLEFSYGVASSILLLKIIGLFCKRAL